MKVSVIVITRNQCSFLEKCLSSITSQKNISPNDYEIIVVNNASTDNTKKVIDLFQSFENLFPIHLSRGYQKSIATCCNIGIEKASGDYIVRVDGDDLLAENALFILSEVLDQNNWIDFVIPDHYDGNENFVSKIMEGVFGWIACGNMYRSELLKRFKYRDFFFEEHDLHIRLLDSECVPYYLALPLYYYRRHDNNLSNNEANVEKGMEVLEAEHGYQKFYSYSNYKILRRN